MDPYQLQKTCQNLQASIFSTSIEFLVHIQLKFALWAIKPSLLSPKFNFHIYALDNKLVCAALFAGLPMAFDMVDHGFLLRTVCKIGLDTTACKF